MANEIQPSGRLAYMRVYVADIIADDYYGALSTEQKGAYWQLLLRAWQQGASLPNDEDRIRKWCGLNPSRWKASRDVLLEVWPVCEDGRRRQKRQTKEFERAMIEYEKKSQGGREGGRGRPKPPDDDTGNLNGNEQDTYRLPKAEPIGLLKQPQLQPEPELEPTTNPPPAESAEARRAREESQAQNRARCWISAECPTFLKSGVAPFSRLILRLGYEQAIAQVEEARQDANVGNPFAYLEAKLDNQRARSGGAALETPRSRKHHA